LPAETTHRRTLQAIIDTCDNYAYVLDTVLESGLIVDGRGNKPYVTDVGLVADRIARLGDCSDAEAVQRLNCRGLVVAPGFIDMHSHTDEILLIAPTADSKIRQGVTTEVGGNCGFSPAPLNEQMLADKQDELRKRYGFENVDWTDFDGFFSALEHSPAVLNFCCLAGLGTVRNAINATLPQPLDADTRKQAQHLVREACEQGAIGISSGLIYPPGRFADTDELVDMAQTASAAGGGLYASHIRNEGSELLAAVDEALTIGRRAACAVQLSHHKASGRRNWGKVHESLAAVDRARASGLDVVLDQYPYKASCTGLDVILPADVNIGGPHEIAARLRDPRYAALVALRIELEYGGRWHEVMISSVASARNRHFEGMTIADIAVATGRSPVMAALRLLVEELLDVSAIYFTMCEDDVRTVLSYRFTCIGSDASARALEGVTAAGKPHPRAYGTFPRIFKHYVRDKRLLSLEEAVRRASFLPAQRLGLRNRGSIAESAFADLVVFDQFSIADTATYADPHHYPNGIPHVFVNGAAVVQDGKTTGARAGRVLRKGRDI